MDPKELKAIVREVVAEVVRELEPTPVTDEAAGKNGSDEAYELSDRYRRGPRHRPLPPPKNPAVLARIVSATPARVATGRTGTRYLTESYLGLRADHAIAIDAVESQIPEGFPEKLGWLFLRTRAADHQEFLLHPDQGRRLDEASKTLCEKEATKNVDIQIIAGDGLSAVALIENGPPLVAALEKALPAAGFTIGRTLCVKFARIGVQDEIGVLTGAKATLVIVGERPGLGTGDSLSIYTAYGPKLGQDNSEKDCISNIRHLGFEPERAAVLCAELFTRTFKAGGGGVKLLTSETA